MKRISTNTAFAGCVNSAGRRRFIRTTTGGMIAAALPLAGCDLTGSVPATATAAWTNAGQGTGPREQALSYAILAPNPHNRQPWLVDLSEPNTIRLYIDHTRLLPETDPLGRQILIGTGAMIGLLEIASAALGYQASTELTDSTSFDHKKPGQALATIRLARGNGPQGKLQQQLFEQVLQRRTDRRAYDPNRPADTQLLTRLAPLVATTQRTGISAYNTDDGQALAQLARDAWKIELETPHTMMESIELLRVGGSEIAEHRDGISISDPMLILLDKVGLFDRSAPPAPGSSVLNQQISDFNEKIASTPGFFWLTSSQNQTADQVEAGRTYVQTQLLATKLGMVMQPVSQALQEYREMKPAYDAIHRLLAREGETIQMLCRIGFLPADVKPAPAAPRRGLADHLIT